MTTQIDDNSTKEISDKRKQANIDLYFEDFVKNGRFLSFYDDEEKILNKNAKNLIISLRSKDENTKILTSGNYIGIVHCNGLKIEINSRFGNALLQRMLNFANDIFVDDVHIYQDKDKDKDKKTHLSQLVLHYLFVQKLERSFLIGLPKSYQTKTHNDLRLKGQIDITHLIHHNMPLKNKIHTKSREQIEDTHIINVLHTALEIVEKNTPNFLQNIKHIKAYLIENKNNHYIVKESLYKALHSKALKNPNYKEYITLLKYAKMIIEGSSFNNAHDIHQSYGFIVNVAELFEIYIKKLLGNHFKNYSVDSPKLKIYKNAFYERHIIPDIVLAKDNHFIVFDTKYKRMKMNGVSQNGLGDLDREDLFQIHTYMSYYQKQGKLLFGGLLYPMEKFEKEKCHNQDSILANNCPFIVDGIELKEAQDITINTIVAKEKEFIERIEALLYNNLLTTL